MAEGKEPADEASDGGYEVGYRKPPKGTRFQPGQSGNPRGRPKGTKNLKTDLMEELAEKIVIREGDQSRRISKQRAVVKTLVTRTLKGDVRAASLLMSMMMRLADTGEGAQDVEDGLLDDEIAILKDFENRARRGGEAPAPREDLDDSGTEDAS